MDKKSSLFMTQKQEDTFGPEGSNPNPEIYKGIKEQDSSKETTPLQLQAVASGYVSNRADFQDMFNKISAGTVKAIEGLRDPETQANRLQDRIDSRTSRGKDTTKLEAKQKTYQDRANKTMQERIEQARALRSASTKYSEDFGENAKAGYDSIFGAGAWDNASDEEKRNFIK